MHQICNNRLQNGGVKLIIVSEYKYKAHREKNLAACGCSITKQVSKYLDKLRELYALNRRTKILLCILSEYTIYLHGSLFTHNKYYSFIVHNTSIKYS